MPKLTVTQNVDDLHERAGSQDVIHLHGTCIRLGASIVGWLIRCSSRPMLCLRMEVGLSRRDAERVMGVFDLESFGLARCFLKEHGVQVSQRLRNAMSSSRLVRRDCLPCS